MTTNNKKSSVNGSRASNSTTNGTTANGATNQIKKCLYCGSKSTPMWRRGPQGAGTLCNACGVKWKHGKILNGMDAMNTETLSAATPSNNNGGRRGSGNNKSEKKRKRSNASNTSTTNNGNSNKRKKRTSSVSQVVTAAENESFYVADTFAVPALPQQPVQQHWEGTTTATTTSSSSTTSTTDSRSPLESFNNSPNTSPSVTTLIDQQQQDNMKRDISNLMSYDTETLSVYVGEDAVEAAAVLTLLKRS